MKTIVNVYRTLRKQQPLFFVLPLFLLCFSTLGTVCLTGCSDDILNPPVEIPTGSYQGQYTFTRKNPGDTLGIRGGLSEIVLTMNATLKTYSLAPVGDSSRILSSQGAYKLAFRKITFTDRSMKTVPDVSLLLNGEFVYTFDGANLVITQNDAATNREKTFYLIRIR
jgi:hypothetical protein